MDQEIRQSILDEEHLKLLSIGYYISSGMIALGSLFSLIYLFIGIMILIGGSSASPYVKPGDPSPELLGTLFIGISLSLFLIMITGAILKLLAGQYIRKRKSRIFCMLIAGIGCLEFPYGTLLGVFTFIVLGRNSVKKLFESAKPFQSDQTTTHI